MSSEAELLRRALGVPASRFEERTLAASRACRRLGPQGRAEALARLRREVAESVTAGLDPEVSLVAEGVTVRDVVEDRWFADAYVSVYDGSERTVEVNTQLVEKVEKLLTSVDLPALSEPGLVRRVALAHELSHHRDYVADPSPPRLRDRLNGTFDVATTLAEVKAVRFSQAWCGLSWSPEVLQLAVRLALGDRDAVEATVDAVEALED